jgi:hypothetical protein
MEEAIDGLNEIGAWSSDFNTMAYTVGERVAAAILAVALIFVVNALANKKENAKNYLILWIIGVIFTLIFILKDQ